MNRTFFAFLACVAMVATSCKKDDENAKLPDNAKIYINGVESYNKSADAEGTEHMTPAQITRYAMKYAVCMNGIDSITKSEAGFRYDGKLSTFHIDTINNRFVLDGIQTSGIKGNPYLEFQDYYFYLMDSVTNRPSDTIAYIPNAQREEAYQKCLILEEQGKWGEIYRIFQEGISFVPCTGKEFREMKKAGTN